MGTVTKLDNEVFYSSIYLMSHRVSLNRVAFKSLDLLVKFRSALQFGYREIIIERYFAFQNVVRLLISDCTVHCLEYKHFIGSTTIQRVWQLSVNLLKRL